ncbi:MAG: hypothetical protein IPP46_14900 [Bacteroidetes bacterium]|nr:hypothetical protein [Bacteroidota bacterium]
MRPGKNKGLSHPSIIVSKFFLPILLLFICSCDHIDEEDIASTDLFPQPVSYPIKIKEGYTINPVTGDSILPIVNSFGDI